MSVDNELITANIDDSSAMAEFSDPLDFLNSSDTEADDLKNTKVENEVDQAGSDQESVNGEAPSLTLSITNVVVMASMRCHLRLKEIARSSVDVEYKALQNHVIMRLRSPYTVATIWSSGKIWCTGANSLAKAKIGARRIARRIAKCGFPCRFSKYRIVNIMATCHLPFRVRLEELVKERPMQMCYEPELAPGMTFKTDPNSSTLLKVFSTGRIVIMGPSLDSISELVEELVPLAALHQTDEPVSDSEDENYKRNHGVSARASGRKMPFLPGEIPMDALGYLDYDDDYGESDDEKKGVDGYSTDNSTDSEASVDSSGVPARSRSRFKTTARSLKPGPPTHQPPPQVMSLRESMDFAFQKRATGDVDGARGAIAAAADLRRERENQLQAPTTTCSSTLGTPVPTRVTDPAWSKKTVASGATKRACVVTYSGTDDSDDISIIASTTTPVQPPQLNTVQQSSPVIRIISSTSGPSTIANTAQCLPQPNIACAQAQPQYVIVTAAQSMPQPALIHPSSASLPVFQLAPATATAASRPIIRLSPAPIAAPTGQNGCGLPSVVYPIRISTASATPVTMQPTSVLPNIGGKVMDYTAQTSAGTQFMSVKCVQTTPAYQVIHPAPGSGPILMGSTFFPQQFQMASQVPVAPPSGVLVNQMGQPFVTLNTPIHPNVNFPTASTLLTNPYNTLVE